MHLIVEEGACVAVGEQPIKGLLDAAVGARMSVAESLTNLVFAPVTQLKVSVVSIASRIRLFFDMLFVVHARL